MGMKFASKFIGALVVKSQLMKLVKGVLSAAGPTNTQKDGLEPGTFADFKLQRPYRVRFKPQSRRLTANLFINTLATAPLFSG
eukprot:1158275-Pelagomonas_calceolata.AAC.5